MKNISFFLLLILFNSCLTTNDLKEQIIDPVMSPNPVDNTQKEIDEILMLLTYSIVLNDWQSEETPRRERRGYNIGALLVDSENMPVHYALNCINANDNVTEHSEVRAITSFLDRRENFDLKGYTVYTTLEPCVMCAGMMTMTSVARAVYGQNDIDYSKAFERLAIDTRPIGGFAPYPRKVEAFAIDIPYRHELDQAYQTFLDTEDEKYLAKFLSSAKAKQIYLDAEESLLNFTVKYPGNQSIYTAAIAFLNKIKDE